MDSIGPSTYYHLNTDRAATFLLSFSTDATLLYVLLNAFFALKCINARIIIIMQGVNALEKSFCITNKNELKISAQYKL